MKATFKLAILSLAGLVLSGCGATAMKSQSRPVIMAPVTVVYVTPNCQVIAGLNHCSWIEPPHAVKPAPKAARNASGIAL